MLEYEAHGQAGDTLFRWTGTVTFRPEGARVVPHLTGYTSKALNSTVPAPDLTITGTDTGEVWLEAPPIVGKQFRVRWFWDDPVEGWTAFQSF